ncbi:MAG: hypothetical protein ACRDQB_08270 [Thermocrispum sp.]
MTASTRFRLTGRTRKTFLVLHIITAAAWFGIDLALGILIVTAMLTSDPQTAGMALQVVDLFAIWPMFVASLLCLGTGVVLGLGSKYGLIRYKWVTVKLGINVAMSVLIFFSLRPGVGAAATIGERLMAGDLSAQVPEGLIYPVVVAPTLLLIAYFLSTFKPWGRTPAGRERPAEPRAPRTRTPVGV